MSDMHSNEKRMAFWFLGTGLLILTLMLLLFAPSMGFLAGKRIGRIHGSGDDEAVNGQVVDRGRDMERKHVRMMTTGEIFKFLRNSIIPKLEMQNLPLPDALEMVNGELRKHSTDLKRPKILIALDYRYRMRNSEPPKVVELRVRNIPAGMALKYICDATKCQLWIENGNVFVAPFDSDRSEKIANQFLDDVRIERFEFEGGHFSEALHLLKKHIDSEDQPSPFLGFGPPSLYAVDAVVNPDADMGNPLPAWGESIGAIRMDNPTVRQVLDELCRLAGRQHDIFEGEIQISPPMEWKSEEDATEKEHEVPGG
jgi:hypothetical protein